MKRGSLCSLVAYLYLYLYFYLQGLRREMRVVWETRLRGLVYGH